ncbi:MAG: DNA polymerase [Candidatus Cloacimonetes bacterium]|nr:DNA polymerase [Candidatus Cloacimonadota bacterium]
MNEIHDLSIDIETYSDVDLRKSGVYRYSESPAFEILLLGYSINGEKADTIDLARGEEVPTWLLEAMASKEVTKWAFNASFERVCLSRWIRRHHPDYSKGYDDSDEALEGFLDPVSWRCTLVWSAYNGLPLSLDGVGKVLKLDEQKLSEGKDLIRYFCVSCAPTITNGGRIRNLPNHAPDKWGMFKKYNIRDVDTEVGIQNRFSKYPVPDFVWDEYHLDQMINDRGILIDMGLVENAIAFDQRSKTELTQKLQGMTALDNPNSVAQMKSWLVEHGVEAETLGKKAVAELIKTAPVEIQDVLSLRLQLAKSSVSKYQAMQRTVCSDGRARGMFFFYGANRTGRWSGRSIQLQNLPQNHIPDLETARDMVKAGDYDATELLYEDIPDTLSQLIRTAFIPRKGYKFIVSDFSAIEARVLSFLAGEQWRLDVFESNGDIYCASASAMFKVPVEKHGVNSHLRQKGKIAELALGYGGSVGALTAMGALDMGLKQEELQPLVTSWRNANPNIVRFWWDVDGAVKEAVRMRTFTEVGSIKFDCQHGMLFITLPSGRKLAYVKPRIGFNQFGGESVTYEGIGGTKKWERLESYGPKFVENIVQATSRDILAEAMKGLRAEFIVGHVHDELIIECPMNVSVEEISLRMGCTPEWLSGIKLRADGDQMEFYQKS